MNVISVPPVQNGRWYNWSRIAQAEPACQARPADEDELVRAVRAAKHVRAVGAGHSFTALVPTPGTLLSLDGLQGMIDHDPDRQRARLWAGTRLYQLGPQLEAVGQALPNMGDVDRQSLAGALATATHGTGLQLPCIAAGLTALRLVTAAGEILECSREHDATLFRAAAVSLGLLGVVTQVELHNQPSYRLRERVAVVPLKHVLTQIEALALAHRHFEFWAFPAGASAIVKTLDITGDPVAGPTYSADSQDRPLWLCSELTRLCPPLAPLLQRLVGHVVRSSERVNQSWRIYPSARNVRFNEMEYHVPLAAGPACMEEITSVLAETSNGVFFPVEYRCVAGDDFMLSPFSDGPRVAIAIHQYHKQDHRPLFARIEPILLRYGGRPHWGKLHGLNAPRLRALYPQLDEFLRLRAELDPCGKFLNPYLRGLFGLD